jgi:MFS family permease
MNKIRNGLLTFILLTSTSLSILCTSVISPALPILKSHFSHIENIDILIKIAVTIPNIFIAIFSPIFGIFLVRFNAKIVMCIFLAIYSLCGAYGYFANDLHSLMVSRAMLGISIAATMTIGTDLITRFFHSHQRNHIIALQTTIMSIGTATFTILGGILADINWRYTFLLYLVALVIIPILLPMQDKRFSPYKMKKEDMEEDDIEHSNFKICLFICIISFVNMAAFFMIAIQIPFLLKSIYPHMSAKAISLTMFCEVVVCAFVAAKYKRVKKNRSFESMCTMALGLMSISYLCISCTTNYYFILAFLGLYGIGMGFMMPNNSIWILRHSSYQKKAFFIGILTTSIYLGKFLSPVISAPIVAHYGMSGSFRVVAFILLFMSVFVGFIAEGLNDSGNKGDRKFGHFFGRKSNNKYQGNKRYKR